MQPQDVDTIADVAALHAAKFSGEGIKTVIEILKKQPALAGEPTGRLLSLAHAYLASGSITDSSPDTDPQNLHPLHWELHKDGHGTGGWLGEMRDTFFQHVVSLVRHYKFLITGAYIIVFGQINILDCASGGATVLLHTSTLRAPGTPATLTNISVDALAPLWLVRGDDRGRIAIARMVQYFAENIGVVAMQRRGQAMLKKYGDPQPSKFLDITIPPGIERGACGPLVHWPLRIR